MAGPLSVIAPRSPSMRPDPQSPELPAPTDPLAAGPKQDRTAPRSGREREPSGSCPTRSPRPVPYAERVCVGVCTGEHPDTYTQHIHSARPKLLNLTRLQLDQ